MEKGNILAIKCGTLITGTGDPPLRARTIVIEGNRITEIIDGLSHPKGVNVLDASDKTVMPGMIDSHVHLASVVGVASEPEYAILKTPEPLLLLHAVLHAREMLESGFTSVRDCVGQKQSYENVSLRDAINIGLIPGPRVVACQWIENTGGSGDWTVNWMMSWPNRNRSVCADGPWEIRKRVREAARAGMDQIKTASSGHYKKFGPMGSSGGLRRSQTREEFKALVDEAHANGMTVMCHSHGSEEGMLHAIEAGVDTIEHAIPLTDEIIKLLVEKDIIIVPTLSIMMRGQERGIQFGVEEARKRREDRLHEVGKAYRAGVRIAMGTDTYRLLRDFWGQNACELEFLVKAGMSEMDAIVSTTKTAAAALGFNGEIGTLEEGKIADVIVLDGDPLKDIRVLQDVERINYVIKNGKICLDRVNRGGALLI